MSNTRLTQEMVERLSTDDTPYHPISTTPITQETLELLESFTSEDIIPRPLTTYETIIGSAATVAIIGISVGIAYNTRC
jgi:hypothetical protein